MTPCQKTNEGLKDKCIYLYEAWIQVGLADIFITTFKRKENLLPQVGGVNGGVKSLLILIEGNSGLRTPELSKILNTPERTLEKWLNKLKSNNLIEYKGSAKKGGYYSKKKNR